MTRVVGLDLSLTATGLAWHDTDTPDPDPQVITLGSRPAGDRVDARSLRLRRLAALVHSTASRADLAVIEGPAYGKSDAHTWDRAGFWWMVVGRLTGAGVPVAIAPPAQVKMYATGKGGGKGAGKDAVLLAIARRYPRIAVEDNNQADAVSLLLMGLRHLGVPYEAGLLPHTHARAMTGVSWPNTNRKDPT